MFETLEYFNIDNFILSGRYRVVIDNDIRTNHIFVTRKEIWDDFFLLPKVEEPDGNGFGNISLELVRNTYNSEAITAYKRKVSGCVIIDNLPESNEETLMNLKKSKIKFGF